MNAHLAAPIACLAVLLGAGEVTHPGRPRAAPPHRDSHTEIHVGVGVEPGIPNDPGTFHPMYVPPPFVPGPTIWLSTNPGTLEIGVDPVDAEVYLDAQASGIGQRFGGWPAKLSVIAGDHELLVVAPGYQDQLVRVMVYPGRTTSIDVRLRPLAGGADQPSYEAEPPAQIHEERRAEAGELALDVRPLGAALYIDGEFAGPADETNLIVPGLDPGHHEVEVVKPGYRAYRGEVVVPAGNASVSLSVRLEAEPQADPDPVP